MTAEPDPAAQDALDRRLVERVRAGDPAAFDALVARHTPRAYRVAFRLMGHREDAQDLVQDAFLAVRARLDHWDSARRFTPWFFRILVNRGLNARRARGVRRTETIPESAAAGGAPDTDAERGELRARVAAALEALPERQRIVVRLFELEGFSAVEIGEILDLSDGTVRWYLHHARKRLRAALGAYREEPV